MKNETSKVAVNVKTHNKNSIYYLKLPTPTVW